MNGLNAPCTRCLWLQIENIINENSFIVETISPWLCHLVNNFFLTFFSSFALEMLFSVFFSSCSAPLKAHSANVALTQSQMANLIDYGLIHSSLALLLSRSLSLSFSFGVYGCVFVSIRGYCGACCHYIVKVVFPFNDRACVLSRIQFGECVRAWENEFRPF